jgi:hypothetical protein
LVIIARQVASGLRVTYQLPQPTTSFQYHLPGARIRNVSWHMLTPGLELVDDEVRAVRAGAFEQFELLITPDAAEHDRLYPALFVMGQHAFVLNTHHLLGQSERPISIELHAAEGQQVTSSFQPPAPVVRIELDAVSRAEKGHYVYFGDPAAQGSQFIVAPGVPAWLRKNLDDVMSRAVPLLGEQFGQALQTRPFVLVAYPDTGVPGATYRGDTQKNGEIALRFRGRGWTEPTNNHREASRFLLHELVHLWNAELFRGPKDEHLAWLHEGSAEYLALLGARKLGLLTTGEFAERVTLALNQCLKSLGTLSLVDPAVPVRSGYYTCGVVVQWLADVSVAPKHDGFAIWRNVFATSAQRDRQYSVEGFLAEVKRLAPPDRVPLLDFLFAGDTPRDWTRLPALVAPHGVRLAPLTGLPWDTHRRNHAFQHILRENCQGGHGFFTFDDHVRLDTGERCGVLSGDPSIVAAEGHDIMGAADRAFRAIDDRCRRGQPVRLRTRDGRSLTAPCRHELPAPAPMLRLE